MGCSDRTWRKMFNCCCDNPSVLRKKWVSMIRKYHNRHCRRFLEKEPQNIYSNITSVSNADFRRTNLHTCNTLSHSSKKDVASLMSSLNASPAIVRIASILNLLKFVFICWCAYYLTLRLTQILLVLCMQAFRDRCMSNTLIPTLRWCKKIPALLTRNLLTKTLFLILHQ